MLFSLVPLRPFGVRFKDHVAITKASTTAVGDHLKLSGHNLDMSSSLTLMSEEDMFKRKLGRPSKYFVGLQHLTETLVTSSSRSIKTFCHVIHSINHMTKCPDSLLDKDSAMESKA